MNFFIGVFFTIVDVFISGALGMVAWNMCIPVVFEGAPQITLIQAIIVAMVFDVMTYDGSLPEDKTDTEDLAVTAIVRIFTILLGSGVSLGILWVIMQMAY